MHQCSQGMDQILIPYVYNYSLCHLILLLSTPNHPPYHFHSTSPPHPHTRTLLNIVPSICPKTYYAQLHYLHSLIRNALYKFWIAKAANVLYLCKRATFETDFNLYHSLGIFSRRQNDVIFLIFPRKQDLTFHANCLLRRQFA